MLGQVGLLVFVIVDVCVCVCVCVWGYYWGEEIIKTGCGRVRVRYFMSYQK